MDTFLWEGWGKPSVLSFISSIFFMKNIPFAPFGSFNATTCCKPLSENCCCISLCFAFTPLVFPSLKQLCLFPHLSPELHTASQLFWACICVPLFPSSRHQHCSSVTSPRGNWCQRGTSLLTVFSSLSRYISFSSVLFPLLACYQQHHHMVTVLKQLVSVQPEACFIPFIKPADSFHFSGTALLSPRRIAACREEGSIAASQGLAALPCWHIQQPVRNHFCWNFWWGRMHIGQDHRIKILPSFF